MSSWRFYKRFGSRFIGAKDGTMWKFDNVPVPRIKTSLPGPRAQALLERDQRFVSPSYTRIYPLVAARGSGAVIEDLDGNLFLDLRPGSPWSRQATVILTWSRPSRTRRPSLFTCRGPTSTMNLRPISPND